MKCSWRGSGDSICHFFTSAFLPSSLNATILSLIPKFPGATQITQFRSISCPNTVYKVISRILVKRLKLCLADLILPRQTTFVKDRLLLENIVLASEFINGYHKNKSPKKITIKVDIGKAFDTLSWEFHFAALQALHLPSQFVARIKACTFTISFMVGYNETVNGYFKRTRGLRQGDTLSPYLFVIVVSYLSHLLNKEAMENKIRFHSQCKSTKHTHLSFADDLLIFIDGSIESVQQVLSVLREFELRSGLKVSMEKTSFLRQV